MLIPFQRCFYSILGLILSAIVLSLSMLTYGHCILTAISSCYLGRSFLPSFLPLVSIFSFLPSHFRVSSRIDDRSPLFCPNHTLGVGPSRSSTIDYLPTLIHVMSRIHSIPLHSVSSLHHIHIIPIPASKGPLHMRTCTSLSPTTSSSAFKYIPSISHAPSLPPPLIKVPCHHAFKCKTTFLVPFLNSPTT
ncbi:hypothetical protein GALMADRAFT_1214391 [Galerina marginata CBS 339.88]|uniref:Uncharacterized protein n=1 Tax=Galerina marginata (strain CBS 339.88) TaxID=685588 RepID=A0A067S7N2_GALM3|nr:hypothetical protein GALMADRAFT_1214391 [Galerina marginata CBS 339.88]